jgi:hypothetical protein
LDPRLLSVFAALVAVFALAHLFADIVPKSYPLAVGLGVPLVLAIVAALDRAATSSIWLPSVALSFAVLNASRLGAPWITPAALVAVAIWLFYSSWARSGVTEIRVSRLAWWVVGTVILVLCVLYGPDLVAHVLGIAVSE